MDEKERPYLILVLLVVPVLSWIVTVIDLREPFLPLFMREDYFHPWQIAVACSGSLSGLLGAVDLWDTWKSKLGLTLVTIVLLLVSTLWGAIFGFVLDGVVDIWVAFQGSLFTIFGMLVGIFSLVIRGCMKFRKAQEI